MGIARRGSAAARDTQANGARRASRPCCGPWRAGKLMEHCGLNEWFVGEG